VIVTRAITAAAAFAASLGPAVALAPPLPCEGSEAGMSTYEMTVLDRDLGKSGVVIERYQVDMVLDDTGVYQPGKGPVASLDGFFGVRVIHCASGYFHAIDTTQDAVTVAAVLSATEYLRAKVQGGKAVTRTELASAVRAVYGKQIRLRETEETCGCNAAFPELRPKGMRPFPERTDTTSIY
jgi:hypothetical protein